MSNIFARNKFQDYAEDGLPDGYETQYDLDPYRDDAANDTGSNINSRYTKLEYRTDTRTGRDEQNCKAILRAGLPEGKSMCAELRLRT